MWQKNKVSLLFLTSAREEEDVGSSGDQRRLRDQQVMAQSVAAQDIWASPLLSSLTSHNLVVTASSPPLVTEIPPPPPPPPPHQTLTSPSDSSKYPLRICVVWNSKLSNIDRALQEIIFDNSFWRRKTIIENILPSHWRDGRTGSFRNWNLPASALLTSQMFPLFAAPREIQNSF